MIKIGMLGETGYTGVELLRLLAAHPPVELELITSRGQAGKPARAKGRRRSICGMLLS